MSVSERIKEMMETLRISNIELARQLGVTHSTVGNWVTSKASIRSDSLERLFDVYPDLSAEWLLRGKGGMLLAHKNPCENALKAEKEKNKILQKFNQSLEREAKDLRKQLILFEEQGYSLVAEPPPEYGNKKPDN